MVIPHHQENRQLICFFYGNIIKMYDVKGNSLKEPLPSSISDTRGLSVPNLEVSSYVTG